MTHELKVWPEFFPDLLNGSKTFEIGDTLILKEYEPSSNRYSGNWISRDISYVLSGTEFRDFGLVEGYCILGLKPIWIEGITND